MKKSYILVLSIFIALLFPTIAFAQSTHTVMLPTSEVVNHDYFAAGDDVHISGVIHGDAYVAGSNIVVDGTVDGDVIAAGRTLTINGKAHNLRIAGKTITVNGHVLGNITAVGQTVQINPSASVSGGLVGLAGTTNILSRLGRDTMLIGSDSVINAPVHGNVTASGDHLTLKRDASISGDLTTSSELIVQRDTGASISGQNIQQEQPSMDTSGYTQNFMKRAAPFFALMKFAGFISTLLVALLLMRLMPSYMNQMSESLIKRPLSALGIGALFLFVMPLVMFLFFITLIGIPISFILFLSYLLILYFAKIIGVFAISRRIFGTRTTMHPYFAFVITLIIYEFILLIPVLGALAGFIIFLMGIGTLLIAKRELYRNSKIPTTNGK